MQQLIILHFIHSFYLFIYLNHKLVLLFFFLNPILLVFSFSYLLFYYFFFVHDVPVVFNEISHSKSQRIVVQPLQQP